MATSFVNLGDCGFWVNDGLLELWLRLLALHVEDSVESGPVATAIRDRWLFASRGMCVGCVPADLDFAVSTEEGVGLVRTAIRSLLRDLATATNKLDKDVLNLMGFSGTFVAAVETRRLVEVGRAFLELLDGKITSGPEDTSFMPGCS